MNRVAAASDRQDDVFRIHLPTRKVFNLVQMRMQGGRPTCARHQHGPRRTQIRTDSHGSK
jgi:hypothetical protein